MSDLDTKTKWDPADRKIDGILLNVANQKLADDYHKLQKNHWRLYFQKYGLAVICLLTAIIVPMAVITNYIYRWYHELNTLLLFIIPGLVILLAWFIKLAYRAHNFVISVQIDAIKKTVANRNRWLFNPVKDYKMGVLMSEKYPEIFHLDYKQQYFDNQFWGAYEGANKCKQEFYYGRFINYFKNDDGGISSEALGVLSIKLDKTVAKPLFLVGKSRLHNLALPYYSDNTIQLESKLFNDSFLIGSTEPITDEVKLEIFKSFPPRFQEVLSTFSKNKSTPIVFIKGNCLMIISSQVVLTDAYYSFFLFKKNKDRMKTNFFKRLNINPSDLDKIESHIQEMLENAILIKNYFKNL